MSPQRVIALCCEAEAARHVSFAQLVKTGDHICLVYAGYVTAAIRVSLTHLLYTLIHVSLTHLLFTLTHSLHFTGLEGHGP